ncbi:hypothetical protein AArcSl_2248 [Halalkaliarchaeum desulfuricum]|uniref:PIN domain-containing protein n=1 Tax=Halalkaliarchaeum desulfuricum TaxID=2055893 RepID=A0A343TLA0_9EURY|nr:hypothetical protein [Halalkaliarchaeum desulfuricum]AUX09872.1 hypothetical protein AArcSl_2248 [Halalkaliarchaeum desulfuricum]
MRVKREHLTVLLNRLYDRGNEEFAVEHPSADIGELLRVELDEGACTVHFTTDLDSYATVRQDLGRQYPDRVFEDLPTADNFRNTLLASGILNPANQADIEAFLDRYGDPDLMAGHAPVFAGFDTNLLPWRIDRVLGLHDPDNGIGYVNGFVLATGIRDELDWDYKCHDTDPFVDAFGNAFEEYWNQPLGSARVGRLGLLTYRRIRDIEQAVEIQSDEGDEAIIDAYDEYDQAYRSDILLFSNDRNFVERARSHRMLGQRVDFPNSFPDEATASWQAIETLLYMLAIVFGIVEVPNTTVYGVWRGKDELDWQHERIKLDARSPKLEAKLEGDLSIVESYEELSG